MCTGTVAIAVESLYNASQCKWILAVLLSLGHSWVPCMLYMPQPQYRRQKVSLPESSHGVR